MIKLQNFLLISLLFSFVFAQFACSEKKFNKNEAGVKQIFSTNSSGLSDAQQIEKVNKVEYKNVSINPNFNLSIEVKHRVINHLQTLFVDNEFDSNIFYITKSGYLHKLDKDLKQLSKVLLKFKPQEKSIFVEGFISTDANKVFLSTNLGKIFAFNKKDLSEDFVVNIDDFFNSPIIPDESYLYLKGIQNSVYGLYDMDGKTAWVHKKDGFATSFNDTSSMVVIGDNLLVANDISSVEILDKKNGDLMLTTTKQASKDSTAVTNKTAKNIRLTQSEYSVISGKDDLSLFSNEALQVSNTFYVSGLVDNLVSDDRIISATTNGSIYTIYLKQKNKELTAQLPLRKNDYVVSLISSERFGIVIVTFNGDVFMPDKDFKNITKINYADTKQKPIKDIIKALVVQDDYLLLYNAKEVVKIKIQPVK
jgi:hypothetical protein